MLLTTCTRHGMTEMLDSRPRWMNRRWSRRRRTRRTRRRYLWEKVSRNGCRGIVGK